MKKMIILLVLFLCGCTNKLTCTYSNNFEDIEIKNKIIFNFDDNTYEQIDKMIFSDSISAASYYNEIIDYEEEYNLNLEDNIIVSKLNGQITLNGEKDEIKKQYEGYEYKCR